VERERETDRQTERGHNFTDRFPMFLANDIAMETSFFFFFSKKKKEKKIKKSESYIPEYFI
jgi:hypothetical protein